jgi:hypothetical protein
VNVAVIFEASGIVRDAFAKRGHNAVSVDLRPSERPGQHIVGDAFEFMRSRTFRETVDLAILHYTCTFLCGSGLHWNKRIPGRAEKTEAALEDVRELLRLCKGKRRALENPVGLIGTRIVKATQYIQPYMFGADASKNTGLWLDGLMPLRIPPRSEWHPGRLVEWPRGSGKMVRRWSNQTDSGQNRLTPADDRWAERSETYPEIAAAFATNWG